MIIPFPRKPPKQAIDIESETEACRREMLRILDFGMARARRLLDDAEAPGAGPAELAQVATDFDHTSRAVCRMVKLLRWLDKPVPVSPVSTLTGRLLARRRRIRDFERSFRDFDLPDDP